MTLQFAISGCSRQDRYELAAAEACFACLQVSVGKGTNSVHRHQSHVRDAVLHFLQHLVPVKLAAGNDGLVTVRRLDMLKVFEAVQSQQQPFNAATFVECFTARQQEFGNLQDLTSRL